MNRPLDPADWRRRIDVLRTLGFADVEHDSHVPFLAHLVGTHRVLDDWGCAPPLCDAGLFHSVYGTEYFHPAALAVPTRAAVRAVIGATAERIAWLWCTVVRDSIDPQTGAARNRHDGRAMQLTEDDVAHIATLWAADTVEQIARMTPDERAFAHGLPRLLPAARPAARSAVAGVRALIDAR